jgi:hypothetical protein
MFKNNVGSLDRVVRIVIGLGALGFFATNTGPMRWLGLIGIIPVVTALAGTCPLYSLFGLSTCPVKK